MVVLLNLPFQVNFFHLFRFRFIQLILLFSLILENHTFREGSDNDRSRQHRDIIHSFNDIYNKQRIFQHRITDPNMELLVKIVNDFKQ